MRTYIAYIGSIVSVLSYRGTPVYFSPKDPYAS